MIDAANEKLEMVSRLLEGKNQIAGNEKLIHAYDAVLEILVLAEMNFSNGLNKFFLKQNCLEIIQNY